MGIVGRRRAACVTGAELRQLTDEQLTPVVRDVDVFARTSPEHKLRIVRALQRTARSWR